MKWWLNFDYMHVNIFCIAHLICKCSEWKKSNLNTKINKVTLFGQELNSVWEYFP